MFDVKYGLLGLVNGLIDVTHRAVAQASGHRIVFLARHIGTHFAQQFQRLVQAPRTIGGRVESSYRGRLGAEEQLKRWTGIVAVTLDPLPSESNFRFPPR